MCGSAVQLPTYPIIQSSYRGRICLRAAGHARLGRSNAWQCAALEVLMMMMPRVIARVCVKK
jgi:hypothetical protein